MRTFCLFCFLVLIFALSNDVQANNRDEILYSKKPWVVVRTKEHHKPTCIAQVKRDDCLFEFIKTDIFGAINIECKAWNFKKQINKIIHLNINGQGLGFSDWKYESNYIIFIKSTVVIATIMEEFSNINGETLVITNDKGERVATFPASGMDAAFKKWKACVAH